MGYNGLRRVFFVISSVLKRFRTKTVTGIFVQRTTFFFINLEGYILNTYITLLHCIVYTHIERNKYVCEYNNELKNKVASEIKYFLGTCLPLMTTIHRLIYECLQHIFLLINIELLL